MGALEYPNKISRNGDKEELYFSTQSTHEEKESVFNDTWSQWGHSVACMTMLLLSMQITRSDIRSQVKQPVNPLNAYGHFNLPQEFVWVCVGWHTDFITP